LVIYRPASVRGLRGTPVSLGLDLILTGGGAAGVVCYISPDSSEFLFFCSVFVQPYCPAWNLASLPATGEREGWTGVDWSQIVQYSCLGAVPS
jgi:hypothetical protein